MTTSLNDRQLAVLRWIEAGCPHGMDGQAYKISAAALRARELIRTSGRGERWRAELTDRGRAYLTQPPTPNRSGTYARATRSSGP
jgi:hypothetical protein